jgi:hypothetical protein
MGASRIYKKKRALALFLSNGKKVLDSYRTCTDAVFVVPEATRAPETITTISPFLPRPDSKASSLPAT